MYNRIHAAIYGKVWRAGYTGRLGRNYCRIASLYYPDSLLLLLGQRVLARGRPHRPRRRGDERHDAPTRGDSTVHGARTEHARSTHRARRTVVVGHAHAHALQPLGLQPLVDRLAVRTKIQMASSVGVRASNM